jgi:heat shock protein HslJ
MLRSSAAALTALVAALPALAEEPSLICFGSEPSWSLELSEPGTARLAFPDVPAVEYRGHETRIDVIAERVWRGKPAAGEGGDVVAFLRDDVCSDGMSDTQHPVTARVSLADGRFLAGCCRVAKVTNEAPTGAHARPAIEGPVWRLESLPGADAKALAASQRGVNLRFDGGRVDGFSGCNQLMGSYAIDGDRVTFGPLAGSMMACPEPAMALETAVRKALSGSLRFAIHGEQLRLTAESGTELAFQAEPPPRLEAVSWQVTGFNNGRSAVVSPVVGTAPTLSFEAGVLTGHTGCNGFRASYTASGDQISIGPAALTRKACPGDGVMEQERELVAAIESAKTWSVRDGMLDVHRADGERVLTAHATVR